MSIFQLKWNVAFLLVVNEGGALSLLPVSDTNTDEAMGKMANVHPGHAFKNAPMPAAFVWELSQRSVGGGVLSQNAQSCDMNCKVIGQSCSFLSVGHSSKGHPPSTRQMKQAPRVICAHTMHLANTPNPTFHSLQFQDCGLIYKRTPGTVPTTKYISGFRQHFKIYHFSV